MTYEELVESATSIIAEGCGCGRSCEESDDPRRACGCRGAAEGVIGFIAHVLREPSTSMFNAGMIASSCRVAHVGEVFSAMLAASPLIPPKAPEQTKG